MTLEKPEIRSSQPHDDVSIVIPSWNGSALLKEFLPSVISAAETYEDGSGAATEIIIVDDGSEDDTADWITSLNERRVRLVVHQSNLGFGPACNSGISAAQHELLLLLNNDVRASTSLLGPLVDNFQDSKVFATHCRVIDMDRPSNVIEGLGGFFSDGFLRLHNQYSASTNEPPLYSVLASGGSSMFRRSMLLELGGFDPMYAPGYYEDADLSYRAWKRGYRILYEPRSVVEHRFSSTTGKLRASYKKKIEARNRILFHWKNIHDRGMLRRNIMWVLLLASAAVFTPHWIYLRAFFAAIRRLPDVLAGRAVENTSAVRSDEEVLEIFDRFLPLKYRAVPKPKKLVHEKREVGR